MTVMNCDKWVHNCVSQKEAIYSVKFEMLVTSADINTQDLNTVNN